MNEEEFRDFQSDIEKELIDYKNEILEMNKEQIYNNYYEICAYNEIANWLYCNADDYSRKAFPKKDILLDVYNSFMDSDFEISSEDLRCFFSDYCESNLKDRRFFKYGEENEIE